MNDVESQIFPVPSSGIGRKDYSLAIDTAVSSLEIGQGGHQRRLNSYIRMVLDTIPYPGLYYWVQSFTHRSSTDWTYEIPSDVSSLFFKGVVSCNTDATTAVGVFIADLLVATGDPTGLIQCLAFKLAPRNAELSFTNGINLDPYVGKSLFLGFAHYTVNPTFTFSALNHYMQDIIQSGE